MPRENKTRYALLGMLSYKPMSGYDMKKMSDHSIGHFWNENFGNIYPVLKKLEAEGLVTMIREDSNGGPSRNTYTITTDGRKILTEWLTAAPDVSPLREELLLQVFFGQWTDPGLISAKVRAEDARCGNIIRELEAIREHMDSHHDIDQAPPAARKMMEEGTPYWRHTVNFGLHYYSGIRDWCAETIKELEK
jgi:PadR family transcriptional regulator AphA